MERDMLLEKIENLQDKYARMVEKNRMTDRDFCQSVLAYNYLEYNRIKEEGTLEELEELYRLVLKMGNLDNEVGLLFADSFSPNYTIERGVVGDYVSKEFITSLQKYFTENKGVDTVKFTRSEINDLIKYM